MRGIAGAVYPDIFQMGEMVQPMLNTMHHRGTGIEQEIYTHKNIQIGMTGGKFSSNKQGTILAGLDGFIKNHKELQNELTKQGYRFTGNAPCELIVHGYAYWGTSLFDHLVGEFALFILDQNQKRLLLCRDRIGKRPLYWFHNEHYFIFASELKALLATGAVPQTPALDSLSAYLYFGYIPQDMSPITDVSKLLPAHYLQYNLDGSKSIHSYWSYSSYFLKANTSPLPKIIEELVHLLEESMKMSLPNGDHVGCFLSGGIGSASIAQLASKMLPSEQITAFTAGYQGENDEDINVASEVAAHLGLEHITHTITPEHFLDDLAKIIWHLDEPLADLNVVATWNLAKITSQKCSTAFSGMGSDELFAGHSRYSIAEQRPLLMKQALQLILSRFQRMLIPAFQMIHSPYAYELMKRSRVNHWQYDYLTQNAFMDEREVYEASPRLSGIFEPEVFHTKFYRMYRIRSKVASYLYFDVKTRLPDNYILQYERLCAAHSLKWRTPFLDRRIVEFLAGLPEPEYLEETETASYLKAMVDGTLPESVVNRPKRTRKEFLKNWMIKDDMIAIFRNLTHGTLVETGMISRDWLNQKINRIKSDPNGFRHLWAILVLELWFQIYVNKGIKPISPSESVIEILKG